MERCVVIDIFFSAPDGWFAEIGDFHGGQRGVIRNHNLREYPVLISGILSEEEVHSVRYFGSGLFDFNRNAKGLHRYYPIQGRTVHKNPSG
jgi:hypothetical protein